MAVVASEEVISGRQISGQARSGFSYTRVFLVQTDNPKTSLVDIANSPGISFGDAHPDDAGAFALSFQAAANGENPLLYLLNVTYGQPASDEMGTDQTPPPPGGGGGGGTATPPTFSGPRPDSWSGTSSLVSTPVMKLAETLDNAEVPITNSAGIPVPGLVADRPVIKLTLHRSYASNAFLADVPTYTGKINNQAWSGFASGHVRCAGCRWERSTQSDAGHVSIIYNTTWDFEVSPEHPWNLQILNQGYQQRSLADGLVDICQSDTLAGARNAGGECKPVTEPWPLNEWGFALNDPNDSPSIKEFWPHRSIDFASYFGEVF